MYLETKRNCAEGRKHVITTLSPSLQFLFMKHGPHKGGSFRRRYFLCRSYQKLKRTPASTLHLLERSAPKFLVYVPYRYVSLFICQLPPSSRSTHVSFRSTSVLLVGSPAALNVLRIVPPNSWASATFANRLLVSVSQPIPKPRRLSY